MPATRVKGAPFVPTGSFARVLAPDAYRISPVVYEVSPVPPYTGPIAVAFHVPAVTVPIDDKLERVVTAVLTSVPDVGRVTDVFPVAVNVVVNAPEVVKSPPIVIVFPVFATPVPPYWPATTEPFQVPVAIVPTLVNDDVTTDELRIVPVSVSAGATTTAVDAAVNWP
jgi:hypothetical protein